MITLACSFEHCVNLLEKKKKKNSHWSIDKYLCGVHRKLSMFTYSIFHSRDSPRLPY